LDCNRAFIFARFLASGNRHNQFYCQSPVTAAKIIGRCNKFYEHNALSFIHHWFFMPDKYSEVIAVIIAGAILALLLVGFIVTMLIVYRKKQYKHEQELLQARLEIQENIFKSLSEEIHDNIGQMLSVLKLTLSAVSTASAEDSGNYLQESKGMLNQVIVSISDLSKSLHTDRIIKIGILEAVRSELEKIEKTNLFTITFNHADCNFQLKPENEIFLFRIIQELLNNVIKHSRANSIQASFFCRESYIVFTFADNGVGFDLKEALQRSSSGRGIGLTSMMNRAKLIGGYLTITSEPGKGTKLVIEIPAVIVEKNPENIIKNSSHAEEVQDRNSG
jgi:two-component system, NarL family, sensor kinase